MDHSEILKLILRGDDGSEFDEHFSDKQQDLQDLDLIRRGVREPRLWHACNFYGLEAFVPEFVDLYLNDLRNMRKWDIVENIDTLLIDSSGPDPKSKLATEWLIDLIQYNDRPYSNIHSTRSIPTVERLGHSDIWAYHYRPELSSRYRNAVFAMAYAWSMELLAFALDGMELSRALATSIYSIAIERRLVELMEFAHEKGADTTDGCDIAAKFGHVEYLHIAHQLGGSIENTCRIAARNGHAECLWVANRLGGSMLDTCVYAAKNGHAECLWLAYQLGSSIGDSCRYAAEGGYADCLWVIRELGGSIRHACENAAKHGHVDCLRLAYELGSPIGRSCEDAAMHGHVDCLEFACMAGGDIGQSCEVAVKNDHFECFLIAQKYGGNVTEAYRIALSFRNAKVLNWFNNVRGIPFAASSGVGRGDVENGRRCDQGLKAGEARKRMRGCRGHRGRLPPPPPPSTHTGFP